MVRLNHGDAIRKQVFEDGRLYDISDFYAVTVGEYASVSSIGVSKCGTSGGYNIMSSLRSTDLRITPSQIHEIGLSIQGSFARRSGELLSMIAL